MKIFTLLKKHTSVYALLLALILLITTATGCTHRSESIEELLPAIKEDYLASYGELFGAVEGKTTVESVIYYGRYNGVEVVSVLLNLSGQPSNNDNTTGIEPFYHHETIAGTTFSLPYGYYIMVWEDGNFMFLQNAYNQGLLTSAQIAEIAGIHADKSYTVFR